MNGESTRGDCKNDAIVKKISEDTLENCNGKTIPWLINHSTAIPAENEITFTRTQEQKKQDEHDKCRMNRIYVF
jgi:hypothetical protein